MFGVPHAKWGETPLAVCVCRPGSGVSEAEMVALIASELGSYQKPSQVIFQTEPLLRSAVGKVDRKRLRAPYWQGRDRAVAGS